jgi:hypothetical protein
MPMMYVVDDEPRLGDVHDVCGTIYDTTHTCSSDFITILHEF